MSNETLEQFETPQPGVYFTPELQELLNFICGKGHFWWLGPGITTYPRAKEDRDKKLFAACLELERVGAIKRHLETSETVIWVPVSPRDPRPVIKPQDV